MRCVNPKYSVIQADQAWRWVEASRGKVMERKGAAAVVQWWALIQPAWGLQSDPALHTHRGGHCHGAGWGDVWTSSNPHIIYDSQVKITQKAFKIFNFVWIKQMIKSNTLWWSCSLYWLLILPVVKAPCRKLDIHKIRHRTRCPQRHECLWICQHSESM